MAYKMTVSGLAAGQEILIDGLGQFANGEYTIRDEKAQLFSFLHDGVTVEEAAISGISFEDIGPLPRPEDLVAVEPVPVVVEAPKPAKVKAAPIPATTEGGDNK